MVDIATILMQWQSVGIFEYALPFLLVFAVIFGILTTTHVLGGDKNKGIHIIIAIIIGLMAVGYSNSLGYSLGEFLQTLFPRLGIGLAVILTILILIGLFVPENERRFWSWGLAAIGLIIALVAISKTFSQFGDFGLGNSSEYMGWIILGVLFLTIIIAVAAGGPKTPGPDKPFVLSPWRA